MQNITPLDGFQPLPPFDPSLMLVVKVACSSHNMKLTSSPAWKIRSGCCEAAVFRKPTALLHSAARSQGASCVTKCLMPSV